MRIRLPLIMILLISIMPDAGAGDPTGYLAGEVRVFANDPLHEGHKRDNMSIVLKPEYYQEWENGSSLTVVPFARIDSDDRESIVRVDVVPQQLASSRPVKFEVRMNTHSVSLNRTSLPSPYLKMTTGVNTGR